MSSRIEQIIEEIEEYIDSCKFQPLSTTKIIVNKDQIDELLRELRMKTPDEIKRYQKIIANKDAILADAQQKAESMIEEAHAQTSELVSEHEIMQQAYAQANEIVMAATDQAQQILDNATNDANDIRIGAVQYTDDLLANAESIIGHTLNSYTSKYDSLVTSLQECYDVVRNNRAELEVLTRTGSRIRRRSRTDGPGTERISSLSEQFHIAKSEQAGYHCGNQLFCYIARKRPVLGSDHAFCLEKRADSSKRTVRHNEKKPQFRSKVQLTEHADSPGQFHSGKKQQFPEEILKGKFFHKRNEH